MLLEGVVREDFVGYRKAVFRDNQCHQNLRLLRLAIFWGRGLGASLLYFAENVARDRGFRELVMHARMTAVGFYKRQGYQFSGPEFEEVTIPHVRMY